MAFPVVAMAIAIALGIIALIGIVTSQAFVPAALVAVVATVVGGAVAPPTPAPRVDTMVVMLMENRAFDHMLVRVTSDPSHGVLPHSYLHCIRCQPVLALVAEGRMERSRLRPESTPLLSSLSG